MVEGGKLFSLQYTSNDESIYRLECYLQCSCVNLSLQSSAVGFKFCQCRSHAEESKQNMNYNFDWSVAHVTFGKPKNHVPRDIGAVKILKHRLSTEQF